MSLPNRLIDKRVVDRYIRKGMVDRTDYQTLIDSLPDMEHNAARVLDEEVDEEQPADEPESGFSGSSFQE